MGRPNGTFKTTRSFRHVRTKTNLRRRFCRRSFKNYSSRTAPFKYVRVSAVPVVLGRPIERYPVARPSNRFRPTWQRSRRACSRSDRTTCLSPNKLKDAVVQARGVDIIGRAGVFTTKTNKTGRYIFALCNTVRPTCATGSSWTRNFVPDTFKNPTEQIPFKRRFGLIVSAYVNK